MKRNTFSADNNSLPYAEESKSILFYIRTESDIAEAMRRTRYLAVILGFNRIDCIYIATVATELASNLYVHAGGGVLEAVAMSSHAIRISTYDQGPGIANIELALQDGYSTAGSLGCGLSGVRRLVDEFAIENNADKGLKVCVVKYKHDHSLALHKIKE